MKELVAKKYVNALLQGMDSQELNDTLEALKELTVLFNLEKFKTIIQSPDVDSYDKESLILGLVEKPSQKFINLIKLLNSNDRLALLPTIKSGLEYQLSLKNNSFEGVVEGMFELSNEQLNSLEESFSKKFDAKINLVNQKSGYPGIRISLEDLGIEVSFSLERLKTQMTEHILKAI
ncbi:MAG: F0F1 ATP synthase subunit delta [Campylobacteraceae bacterium]|nr:F0F1 ATP synthase subunit delta [Campylobacteraceae bacterium]